MNFETNAEDMFVKMIKTKKYGGFYSVRYDSPVTGKLTHVSIKRTGRLASKEEAMEWANKHLRNLISEEVKLFERQNWRSNDTIVRHYNEYAKSRLEELPRSAQQDLSMLINFGIPFFICEVKQNDPNTWGDFGEEFMVWLKEGARTRKSEPLTVSSCNKVINSANQFLKWMKKKKIIEYKNFKQLEAFDQRKQNRRGSTDLVTPEVFEKVHSYLKFKNPLYADMWFVQRQMGFRANELLGLPFNWLSDECPDFIKSEFEGKELKVHGSIYLESQPALPYIKRVNGLIERAPLKWRPAIGPDYARTIPVCSEEAWNILVRRYETQCDHWEKQTFGPYKESYLLFDGAQRNRYLDTIREAYEKMGLESDGTHVLRHTVSTEWTYLKISERVCELVLGHKGDAHNRYVHIVGLINSERQKSAPMKRLLRVA